MKKILSLLSVIFLTFGCYDDSDIRNELRNHEERLAKLETLCKQMNTNISALQTIVSTLQKNVFVTAVTPIKEGSDIVGYTISFSNSESVTIYHGRDGVDGEDGTDGADGINGITPSIGVRQDTDGIYYWTLDGEWLLDATGKKVQAIGRDGSDGAAGKTPQLKIENGYWMVSYDGEKWTQLGKATGESANLIGITQDDKNVYFTLTDGTVISIPKGNGGSQDDEGGAEDGSQTISKGPITLSLGEVTATTATFTARLDVDMMADYQEVGLVYSKDDDMDVESETITKVKINKESYSETFTGLQYDTDFYYTVYTLRNNVYSYGATQTFKTKDVTISVDDVNVTNTTATFIGKVVRDEADASVEVGIQYSEASSFESTSSLEVTPEEDGVYNVTCDGLYFDKEYYYRTYVCQDGVYEYSDAMTFTTNAVTVELNVESNTQTTVQFKGKIDPSTAIDEVQIAVLINTSETVTKSDYSKKYTLTPEDIKEDGSFDVSMSGLKFGTTYYYTYYVLNNSTYSYGTIQNFKTEDVPVNLSVGEITQTAATISVNISLTEKNVLEVGLLYSSSSSDPKTTTSGVNKVVLTDMIDADGNFTYKAENLLNETTHYYRYYIKQGSAYTYGDVSTFKTEKVPVTIEVESIDKNVVTFKGNVQFSETGVIEIGVQYYPKSTTSQSAGIQMKTITEISENGDFTVEISGLLSDTEYYWQYYLLQNGVTIVGLPQTFEIADLYNIQSDLNISSASDLSSSASANCYIISESGLYKFKTVKGNSSESVGSVASASILWETFGTSTVPDCFELIDGVCYKDGYIVFQTADTFKEGNAVIASKDASGNVLWSWHIWLTDQPQEQTYYNNAGTMMDRNLGATSATPGDVGAIGLLYQWGRKDPFLGSSSIRDGVEAKSTIIWPSEVSSTSSNGTIAYATAHPTTFITRNTSNNDWYYPGSSSTDNTRWTTSEKDKSIYDPCPVGWRVPDGGRNGIWSKAGFDDTTYDSTNKGISFSISSPSKTWYPASGYRYYNGGGLGGVGFGYYWSASPYDNYACLLSFLNGGSVSLSASSYRAFGYSVRCLQE